MNYFNTSEEHNRAIRQRMPVTTNPYTGEIPLDLAPLALRAWDEGYRQALLDIAQYMLDHGHGMVGEELLRLEDELHAKR